jgi:hypothetical protein
LKPICIDLFCGLGGWTDGFLAEGYECIGYDIEAHDYGTGGYPGTLILRDVLSIHGSEFKDAACIVASPPCQAYSYRAMPWKLAKALPPPSNDLFWSCFRIQREAIQAAGHYIPMVVENVRGAQKWVGQARFRYGSFYLWGDVPALMPQTVCARKLPPEISESIRQGKSPARWTNPDEYYFGHKDGVKQAGISGPRNNGKGDAWFQDWAARHGSKSNARKAASAMIAKIPFPLAHHVAKSFKPKED